jgi:ABC-2 type transport system ATP-binding protein
MSKSLANRENSSPHLELRDLHKNYGPVHAVKGINLKVSEGICFGLLGPNGAGKTTTIEMVEGLREPSRGEILVKGEPRSPDFRDRIGIQLQSTDLQQFLRVGELLEMFQGLYSDSRSIPELIELCQLEEFLDRDHAKISGGQRQRLLLALALVNDPELVFLDEPTTGLDPQARRHVWALVEKIKGEGKTIILTTHYMEEASVLCDEIAIVDHGEIIAQGTPESLIAEHFSGVTLALARGDSTQAPLAQMKESPDGKQWLLGTETVGEALRELIDAEIDLRGLAVQQPNLEDLFIKLTGRRLRT